MFRSVVRSLSTGVYLVDGCRTPFGTFQGSLSGFSGVELGEKVVSDLVHRTEIDPILVDELIVAHTLFGGLGQNPTKAMAYHAGLPGSTITTGLNKACAGGMKAAMVGAMGIMIGQRDCVFAGGVESMSNGPFYVTNLRKGHAWGNSTMIDSVEYDGLIDQCSGLIMGAIGDRFAENTGCTREEQDAYSIESYKRAIRASDAGLLEAEIVSIDVLNRKGEVSHTVSVDERLAAFNEEKIPQLRAAFTPDGTLTAGNVSPLSDGASMLMLGSEKLISEQGLKPRAKILGFADAEQESKEMPSSPYYAMLKALENASLDVSDVDFFEINEPFAVVLVETMKMLDVSHDIVNVYGGSVALGHPLACSASKILVTLMNVLEQHDKNIGVAGICNGGGGASAMVIERIN